MGFNEEEEKNTFKIHDMTISTRKIFQNIPLGFAEDLPKMNVLPKTFLQIILAAERNSNSSDDLCLSFCLILMP